MWIVSIGYTGGLLATGQFVQVIASRENSKLIQTKSIATLLWSLLVFNILHDHSAVKQRKIINNFPVDQSCVSSANFLIVDISIRIVCLSCSRPQFRCPQSWQLWQLWHAYLPWLSHWQSSGCSNHGYHHHCYCGSSNNSNNSPPYCYCGNSDNLLITGRAGLKSTRFWLSGV